MSTRVLVYNPNPNPTSTWAQNALWLIEHLRLTFKPCPVWCWQEVQKQKQTVSQSGHRRFHVQSFFCYSDVTLQSLLSLENTNYNSAILFFPYLAIRRGFSAGAGWSLSLHFRSCLGNPNPHKVDDMVQIGEEVSAREPAVVAMLLNARLLEA